MLKVLLLLAAILLAVAHNTPRTPDLTLPKMSLNYPVNAQSIPQETQFAPSVNMTTVGFGGETSVAVNPTDPSNIIVTGTGIFDGDHFEFVHVSFDGGRTWRFGNASVASIGSIIHGGWTFFDSVGTFDDNGSAYVGTLASGVTASSFANYLLKSTDGGRTFTLTDPFLKMNDSLLDEATGVMVHPCYQPPGPNIDYPAVIADAYNSSPFRNNVYVFVRIGAQVDAARCAFGVAFERSTDGGKTWGSGMWLGPSYSPPYSPFGSDFAISSNRGMAVAPDGTVLLSGIANGKCDPMVLRSTDGGASFQEACYPNTTFDVDQVEIAASSVDSIYVAFLGENGTAFHLYSVVSQDGGISWSAPALIDKITSPDVQRVISAGGPFMWDLNLSPVTGRLDVAWLDDRNSGGNYTLADIYYSYSYDGLTWASNIRATPQGPYYICERFASTPKACYGNGNDFMWVASSYTPGSNKAYIVAAMGEASCGPICDALLTRFVTVTFPSPSLHLSTFFTDSRLNPLPLDDSGSPLVNIVLTGDTVERTNPNSLLAWANFTNIGSAPVQSLKLNVTLPVDWSTDENPANKKKAVHIYFANTTSPRNDPEIKDVLKSLSTSNPETVSLTISNFNSTVIGHPMLPGESVLVSVKLTYNLTRTSQTPSSYPRNYTEVTSATVWTQPSFTGLEAPATGTSSFTAYAEVKCDNRELANGHPLAYTIV